MITDNLLLLSDAQAVTASAASTNTVDLGTARDIGEGEELYVHFKVDTTFTAAGAATMTMNIITSASADLSTPTILASTAAIAVATLVAGYRTAIEIPPQIKSLGQRYIGVSYTIATGPMTAGAISARIVKDIQDGQKFYASGFTVA